MAQQLKSDFFGLPGIMAATAQMHPMSDIIKIQHFFWIKLYWSSAVCHYKVPTQAFHNRQDAPDLLPPNPPPLPPVAAVWCPSWLPLRFKELSTTCRIECLLTCNLTQTVHGHSRSGCYKLASLLLHWRY